jgi:hypothetical protein
LKAYEHKEIRKLQRIGDENSKILAKLNHISQGKELSVGHHLLHEQSGRPKTLNIDRFKQVNDHIDYENRKISHAICTARPKVPLHDDFKAMGQ